MAPHEVDEVVHSLTSTKLEGNFGDVTKIISRFFDPDGGNRPALYAAIRKDAGIRGIRSSLGPPQQGRLRPAAPIRPRSSHPVAPEQPGRDNHLRIGINPAEGSKLAPENAK